MSLGEMIEEIRKDKGLQQKDLAELLNVSRPTISNYESNVHNPDIENLIKIADAFEVSADYLLGRIRFNVNIKELNRRFVENNKNQLLTGEVLKEICNLSNSSKIALIEYISLLKLKDQKQNNKKS